MPLLLKRTIATNCRNDLRPMLAPELQALGHRLKSLGVCDFTEMDCGVGKVDRYCIAVPVTILLVGAIEIKIDHVLGSLRDPIKAQFCLTAGEALVV